MRQASNNDKLMDGETFVGFNLGADFTSEHEWGIKDIRSMFGMKDGKMGIDRRTATTFPEEFVFFKKGKEFSVLICDDSVASMWGLGKTLNSDEFSKELEKGSIRGVELNIYKGKELATSWDGGGFGILVPASDSEHLEQIYEAIKAKNVSIWLGGGGVFENAGLVVAIRSLLPKEGLKTMKIADEDAKRLQKADIKTGIKAKLEKAGKKYFACSPKWAEGFKDIKTKHKVIYWLNPMEQQKNHYGWYTVEDLEEWVENKGKIPMKETA